MPEKTVYKPTPQDLQKIYKGGELTPPKFMPTYFEWLFKEAKSIGEMSSGGIAATGTLTIYTVPANFIFYLTSCCLGCWGTAGDNRLTLRTKDMELEFLTVVSSNAGTTANISANYSHPIKIESKAIIQLVNHHNRTTQFMTGIAGFLVNKNVLI